VTAIDSLMLEAKQAIMEEHHHRFQTLHQDGRWEEALREIQVTLNCAADLLNDSLQVLEKALDDYAAVPLPSSGTRSDSSSNCPRRAFL
jgi:hypothetical protein